jgi:hypothetical protein
LLRFRCITLSALVSTWMRWLSEGPDDDGDVAAELDAGTAAELDAEASADLDAGLHDVSANTVSTALSQARQPVTPALPIDSLLERPSAGLGSPSALVLSDLVDLRVSFV